MMILFFYYGVSDCNMQGKQENTDGEGALL